ncbi:DUF2753 family protein [Aeromonas diversa]|nr:DUF2753 family protein [Aeromonas diversa]
MNRIHWQEYMLEARVAQNNGAFGAAVCLYQRALELALEPDPELELAEQATMQVATCHRLAQFWGEMQEPTFELRYLKLASELVTALVPQCPHRQCAALIGELGCCRAALLAFLKRHPTPEIARLIQTQEKVQACELIGRFRLN